MTDRRSIGDRTDPTRGWGRWARSLAAAIRRLVPAPVADDLLCDLDDAFRRRGGGSADSAAGARRWLLRQLLMSLRPKHLRDLRRVGAGAGRAGSRPGGPRAALRHCAGIATDLRHSARLLLKSPGVTALSVVVLAGGLAVSIFTFSLLYTAIYKPLPLPDGERVVRVVGVEAGRTTMLDAFDLAAIRDDLESFAHLGAYETRYVRLRGEQETRSLYGTYTEPVMFEIAGIPPRLGRRLLPRDAAPGAEPVVVLSHSVWRATFGADTSIVGRLVDLNGASTRIVGVMPEGFGFPVSGQLWLPLEPAALAPYERGRALNVFAELRRGVSFERADAELGAAIRNLRAGIGEPEIAAGLPRTAKVRTFQKAQFGDQAELLSGIFHLAAGLILLLAGVNAGSMMLARGLERSREIDLRLALGAPRSRLVLQMMGEGLLVALAAGVVAVIGAGYALSIFDDLARTAFPEGLAFWWRWGLDGPTLLVAAMLVLATVLVVAGVPAWRVTRAGSGAVPGEARHRQRRSGRDPVSRLLVTGQIAVIAILLFVGGTTGWVSLRAATLDLGLDTERVLIGLVGLPESEYPDAESRVTAFERIAERLSASPVVEGVQIRAGGGNEARRLETRSVAHEDGEQGPTARVRANAGDAGLLGVQLLAGRRFDGDTATGEPTAVVSRSLGRKLWGEASPLGRRLRIAGPEGGFDERPWRVVVGVVSDVVEGNPLARDRDTVYLPFAQVAPAAAGVTFRHRGDPRAAISAFHETLAEVAPTVVPERIVDFDEMVGTVGRMARSANRVLLACFGFALLLAVGGIYGLTARRVTLRSREMGIRRALGATDGQVVRLLLRGGLRQLAIGLGVALVVAAGLAVVVTRLLALDGGVFVATGTAVSLLISTIVLTATYLPARRALRLAPRETILRE